MEVYQSSKTAAEMEYALSAIPSIGANNHWFIGDVDTGVLAEGLTPYVGENGNWWVGDLDTGVYASGAKVTGAEVGQTILVKAVDENGVPTEWEPGNAGAKWNLVRHLVVEEAVTSLSISSDEAGNPISDKKYSEMYVDYYIPGLGNGNYSSRYGSISFWFNGGWGGGKSVDFSNGGNGYDNIRSAVHAVRPPIQGVGLSGYTPVFYAIMVHSGQIQYTVYDTECLVGVNIRTAAGITAGSVFNVYAR